MSSIEWPCDWTCLWEMCVFCVQVNRRTAAGFLDSCSVGVWCLAFSCIGLSFRGYKTAGIVSRKKGQIVWSVITGLWRRKVILLKPSSWGLCWVSKGKLSFLTFTAVRQSHEQVQESWLALHAELTPGSIDQRAAGKIFCLSNFKRESQTCSPGLGPGW